MNNTSKYHYFRFLFLLILLVQMTAPRACGQRNLNVNPGSIIFLSVGQAHGVLASGAPTTYSILEDPPPPPSFDPSANQNYIVTKTMLNSTGTSSFNKVDYFDGLGRPVQTILHNAAPGSADIVTLEEYDEIDRPVNTYLPTPVTTSNGAYTAPATVKSRAIGFYADARAFEETVYEPSPLNRVDKIYGPGAAWHTNEKHVANSRHTNSPTGELSCALYTVASVSSLKHDGSYAPRELFVTKTTGEDGQVSYTFTDKLGQVVLERVMNGSEMNDTYYVHDDFGNLRYVLPPAAADALTANTTWADTHAALVNYAYIYKYDGRNRCVQKRLPGCEPIEMHYDKADRLVFSRDGNRNNNEWLFYFHDVFGRQTVSGVWKSASIPDLSGTVVRTTSSTSGTNLGGYTVNLSPLPPLDLMTVNYYDNHEFILGVTELNYVTPPAGYDARFNSAKGLLTGTRSYRLDDPSRYTVSAIYHDHRGRIVQTHASNHLGGFDHEYLAYTFTGKVKQRGHVHYRGNDTITETYYYDYGTPGANPTERLQSVSHKLNDATPVTLARYSYDEVGRIQAKTLASETSNYSYNVRGWLTGVEGSRFNQTLAYNTSINSITPTKALYSGNISAMKWKSGEETTERGYKFTYDSLNRLTGANYGEGDDITSNPDRFNEKPSYDKMGNITTLQRRGKVTSSTYNLIDNLTYTYNGNRLTKVSDAVTTPITNEDTFHFVDGVNQADEYTYDANGNLTKDLNKNITSITYNALNLPKVITFGDGKTITYGYDAAGSKLSVTYNMGNGVISRMEYAGNKVYKNGTLGTILTGEGYVTMDGSTPKYHYYLKDHQGNNRVVIDQAGTVEQVNHYYPFGGLFGEGLQDSNQPYKYNGKELDHLHGLDLYDFHWRHYMAALGRTTTLDPHAENYYSLSPYSMFSNNPMNVIDPTGMDTVYVNHTGRLDYRKGGENDIVYVTNEKGDTRSRTYELGTLRGGGQRNLKGEKEGPGYAYLSINNKKNSKDIFEFLADNTTVEFGSSTFRNEDGTMSNYITTSHENNIESGFAYLSIDYELYNSALLSYDHSHPDGTPYPSGMPDSRYLRGDIPFSRGHVKGAITNLRPIPTFRIYVPRKGYRKYHINSTLKQFQGMPDYYWEK